MKTSVLSDLNTVATDWYHQGHHDLKEVNFLHKPVRAADGHDGAEQGASDCPGCLLPTSKVSSQIFKQDNFPVYFINEKKTF